MGPINFTACSHKRVTTLKKYVGVDAVDGQGIIRIEINGLSNF